MGGIRWEDPPPAKGGPQGWAKRLGPLMEHPERWAIIATKSSRAAADTTTRQLRLGTLRKPPGRWEFAARTVDGEHRVYGRYLGPPEDGGS